MKENICQDKIYVLTEYSHKTEWEKKLRYLWSTCFQDPKHYEDFYFCEVYPKNTVYAMEDKGMVHVNPYLCKVLDCKMMLPYIVGVSTNESFRRQGVMRCLLEQIFSDLHEQKVPFVYLMPAKEEYYTSFGFQSVSKRVEYEIENSPAVSSKHLHYLSYGEIQKMSGDFQAQLFAVVNQWLEQRYQVYAIHEKAYFDLLYAEKCCQRGDVVFAFEDIVAVDRLCGMFAYAMDGELPYVEQLIVKDSISEPVDEVNVLLGSYFNKYDRISLAKSYPYMLRIVHRETFFKLFGKELSKVYDGVVDELTDAQIIKILFAEKDNIYFAEII